MAKRINKEIEQKICELYSCNRSITDIISETNVTNKTIYNILKRNNICLKMPPINPRKKNKISSRCGIKYDFNENFFEKLDTKESCYFSGLISSDGNLSKTSNNVKIELKSTDVEILEKFNIALNTKKPLLFYDKFDKRTNKTYHSCQINICRYKIYSDLINHGITPDKSDNLRIPKINDDLMHYYIRGWSDGDAGWNINKSNQLFYTLVSSSYEFIFDLKNILQKQCNLDEDCKIHHIEKEHVYKLIYSGNKQTRKIFNYIYKGDLEPKLNRKYNYCKNHFDNLDNNVVTRKLNDFPISQNAKLQNKI